MSSTTPDSAPRTSSSSTTATTGASDAGGTDSPVVGNLTVAIIGLGEVGRIYGAALHEAGHKVSGYDPYAQAPVEGVRVSGTLADAVDDAEVVLVLTAAGASRTVAEQSVEHLRGGA